MNYKEHPSSPGVYVPEEKAAEYAEEEDVDLDAPAFERKAYEDLTDHERVHGLRVELAQQTRHRGGKFALRVSQIQEEVFDGTPSKQKVRRLIDRASDGDGFDTDVKRGKKRLLCTFTEVTDNEVLADVELADETAGVKSDKTDTNHGVEPDDTGDADRNTSVNENMDIPSSTHVTDGGRRTETSADDCHHLGVSVVHQCETDPTTGDRSVCHVVLPPRQLGETPITDMEDAGYEVIARGVFPGEIPGCPKAEAYPGCEHLLLRQSR